MVRDEYRVMTTSASDLLICTKNGIQGDQQSSAYENRGSRVVCQHKERMGQTFTRHKGGT